MPAIEEAYAACARDVAAAQAEFRKITVAERNAQVPPCAGPSISDYLVAAEKYESARASLQNLEDKLTAHSQTMGSSWAGLARKTIALAVLALTLAAVAVLVWPVVTAVAVGVLSAGLVATIGTAVAASLSIGTYVGATISLGRDIARHPKPWHDPASDVRRLGEKIAGWTNLASAKLEKNPELASAYLQNICPLNNVDRTQLAILLVLTGRISSELAFDILQAVIEQVTQDHRDLADEIRSAIEKSRLGREEQGSLLAQMLGRLGGYDSLHVSAPLSGASLDVMNSNPLRPGLAVPTREESAEPVPGDDLPSDKRLTATENTRIQEVRSPSEGTGDAKKLKDPIVIRVWVENPKRLATGHAAMTVGKRPGLKPLYITWWPPAKVNPDLLRRYQDDKRAELKTAAADRLETGQFRPRGRQKPIVRPDGRADWGVSAEKIYLPCFGENHLVADPSDTVLRVFGLCGASIHKAIGARSARDFELASRTKNCAGTILAMMKAGGAKVFGTPPRVNVLATPSHVLKYAMKIVGRIDSFNKKADDLIELYIKDEKSNSKISLATAWAQYRDGGGTDLQDRICFEDTESTDSFHLMRKTLALIDLPNIRDRPMALALLCGLRNQLSELSRAESSPSVRKPLAMNLHDDHRVDFNVTESEENELSSRDVIGDGSDTDGSVIFHSEDEGESDDRLAGIDVNAPQLSLEEMVRGRAERIIKFADEALAMGRSVLSFKDTAASESPLYREMGNAQLAVEVARYVVSSPRQHVADTYALPALMKVLKNDGEMSRDFQTLIETIAPESSDPLRLLPDGEATELEKEFETRHVKLDAIWDDLALALDKQPRGFRGTRRNS